MRAMDRIVGQDRAVAVLEAQLTADRLHHAYVFGGPAGVGKFTTAAAFARLLLCHDRQRDLTGRLTACGACESCQLIPPTPPRAGDAAEDAAEAGNAHGDATHAALNAAHPDLHVVTKELAVYSEDRETRTRKLTQIPVEVLREHLLGPVQRVARLRHGKVFVVDEAEMLNPTGQNLLLKTLEEPPAGTRIILVTASEDRLLPTIRSRCHRIAFVPLSDEAVEGYVQAGLPAWRDEAQQALDAAEAALKRAPAKQRKAQEAAVERARHHRHWLERLDEQATRHWLVGFADGSLGRAKLAIDYDLAEWAHTVLPALDRLAAGQSAGALGQAIGERIEAFARRWVERHENASKEAANKLGVDLMGTLIAGRARRKLGELAQTCAPDEPLTNEPMLAPWLGAIEAVQRMRELVGTNVNLSLACDHLATRLALGDES